MAETGELRAVLFACNWNTVRSPMAAALLQRELGASVRIESCGLEAGEALDPFAWAVLKEVGIDLADHHPKSFGGLAGDRFDLVVSLTPQAEPSAEALAQSLGAELEIWPCSDPTLEDGSREQRLDAYRQVRRDLEQRLARRFGPAARS